MIFGRGRALRSLVPTPESSGAEWIPEPEGVRTCAAELTGDPLAAGQGAYGAFFRLGDSGAVLHIWAYTQFCGTAEGFIVAFRVDRIHEDAMLGDDDCTSYADASWAEWFDSAATAEANAMQAAALLLAGDRGAALSLYAEPDAIAGWFDWDGVPV
jgi:hypothetical protein